MAKHLTAAQFEIESKLRASRLFQEIYGGEGSVVNVGSDQFVIGSINTKTGLLNVTKIARFDAKTGAFAKIQPIQTTLNATQPGLVWADPTSSLASASSTIPGASTAGGGVTNFVSTGMGALGSVSQLGSLLKKQPSSSTSSRPTGLSFTQDSAKTATNKLLTAEANAGQFNAQVKKYSYELSEIQENLNRYAPNTTEYNELLKSQTYKLGQSYVDQAKILRNSIVTDQEELAALKTKYGNNKMDAVDQRKADDLQSHIEKNEKQWKEFNDKAYDDKGLTKEAESQISKQLDKTATEKTLAESNLNAAKLNAKAAENALSMVRIEDSRAAAFDASYKAAMDTNKNPTTDLEKLRARAELEITDRDLKANSNLLQEIDAKAIENRAKLYSGELSDLELRKFGNKDGSIDFDRLLEYRKHNQLTVDTKWEKSQIRKGQYTVLGAAFGAATSGTFLYKSIKDMFTDFSVGGLLGGLGSFTGLVVSLKTMHSALTGPMGEKVMSHLFGMGGAAEWLSSGKGIAAISIAIAAAAILKALLGSKKSPEELALEQLTADVEPTFYSPGAIFLAAGVALGGLGLNMAPTAIPTQGVPVLRTMVDARLNGLSGGALSDANKRYGTAFVMQGQNGAPTRVIYLTKSNQLNANGKPMDIVNMVTLADGTRFVDPQGGAYIPFFAMDAKGTTVPNPAAINARAKQNALLSASSTLNTRDGQNAVGHAGGTSHGR